MVDDDGGDDDDDDDDDGSNGHGGDGANNDKLCFPFSPICAETLAINNFHMTFHKLFWGIGYMCINLDITFYL